MKIVDVVPHPLEVPLDAQTSKDVPWVWGSFQQLFVEIRTDEGLTGWGEAFAYGTARACAAMIEDMLKPLLVGEDPADIRGLTQRMFQKTHLSGRYGVTTFAISGVEIALWDLAGKRAGLPLYELLGGAKQTTVPAYASLVRYPEEHERIVFEATQAVERGYSMIKLHQTTPESVELVRDAIGDNIPITVDVNCEWSTLEATRRAEAMSLFDILWLEEPIWPPEDYDALAEVQASTGVSLSSGENACTAQQFKLMMDAGAVRFVQPSVIKVGGIGQFLEVCRLAAQYNLEVAPHSPYFGPGFVATLHLIAHTGQPRWVEKIYFDLGAQLFTAPLPFANGIYSLPTGPGLGVEPNPQVLKDHALKR